MKKIITIVFVCILTLASIFSVRAQEEGMMVNGKNKKNLLRVMVFSMISLEEKFLSVMI